MGELLAKQRQRRKQHGDRFGELWQDLRYALRTLRREPAFTTVTVLILALGIAANTAVFSVVNTVLLRPLPFPEAHQLTWLASDRALSPEIRASAGLSAVTYTVAAFEEFQRHNRSFESVTGYNPFFGNSEYNMTGRGEPQSVTGVMVAGNFFETLGIKPVLGRLFLPEECKKGGHPAVLLSYGFWRRQFAGDPNIVGRSITLSKQPYTVIGVLPATFDFGSVFSPGMNFEVFTPAVMDVLRYWGNTLAVLGRLKPGVSVPTAQAEADVLFPQFKAAHQDWFEDYASTLTGLKEYVAGKLRLSLILLWSAVGLVLLIVCVNLSNLQLARATSRSKEFAMRAALGASRGRLFRQLLTESLVLVSAGALLGLGVAFGIAFYLSHQESIALPLLSSVRLDGTALVWTLAIAASAALLFGLVPALRLFAANIQENLKNSGQGVSTGRKHERLRAFLVVSEVALACVLLIGAGLLLRSFLNVLDVDLGFQPSRSSVIKIDYDDGGSAERRGEILHRIQQQIAAIPGIEAAGITDMLPLGRNRSWGFGVKGKQYPKDFDTSALVRIVTPGYLEAMGVRVASGHDFTWPEALGKGDVIIFNQAAARRFWPGEDALGRIVLMNGHEVRVVGIVSDLRQNSLEVSAEPEMFLPASQADPEGAELVVRSRLPVEALSAAVMKTLRSINPSQPAARLEPLQQIVDRAVSPRRFFVVLVSGFAALGLILASLGIYGVISYSVARQTQEIGIRMALGASASQVRFGVVARALRLAFAGALIGAFGSFLAAKWIASLLFGTRPTDPATFGATVLLLCAVSLAAAYVPARKASRIQPIEALRVS
jgi:predicted permease